MSGGAGDNSSLKAIADRIDVSKLDSDDHAILANLVKCAETVAKDYGVYQFNAITQSLYAFFWNDFCGWYLEVSKSRLRPTNRAGTVLAVQDLCLRQTLLLLHPFMPFITEELWHSMGFGGAGEFIQNVSPDFADELAELGIAIDENAAADTEKLKDLVAKSRALKAQCKVGTKRDSKMSILPADAASAAVFDANSDKLKKLVGAETFEKVSVGVRLARGDYRPRHGLPRHERRHRYGRGNRASRKGACQTLRLRKIDGRPPFERGVYLESSRKGNRGRKETARRLPRENRGNRKASESLQSVARIAAATLPIGAATRKFRATR